MCRQNCVKFGLKCGLIHLTIFDPSSVTDSLTLISVLKTNHKISKHDKHKSSHKTIESKSNNNRNVVFTSTSKRNADRNKRTHRPTYTNTH